MRTDQNERRTYLHTLTRLKSVTRISRGTTVPLRRRNFYLDEPTGKYCSECCSVSPYLTATSVWYKPYCRLKLIHSQPAPGILTIFPLSLLCFIPSLMSSSYIRDNWEESFQWEVLEGWEVGWKRGWAWVKRGSRIHWPLLLVPSFLFLFLSSVSQPC